MEALSVKRILVPYDFSKQAMNALDTAIAISQQQNASVLILHVIDNSRSMLFGLKQIIISPVQDLARIAAENLNMLVKTLSPKHDFAIEYQVEVGIPAFTICKVAWENDSDLVVMGKVRPALKRIFQESVSYKVVKSAPCPVLSIPAERLFTRFKKIVFPVRAMPLMVEKYDLIRSFVRDNGATMVVAGLTSENNEQNYKRVSSSIEAVTGKLLLDGVRFTSRITFCTSISGQLLEISENEEADLIVITCDVGSFLTTFFLEYYTRIVVENASCPVLSIHPDMLASN
jgi:nucleotide-binding universal stress UspA family protein